MATLTNALCGTTFSPREFQYWNESKFAENTSFPTNSEGNANRVGHQFPALHIHSTPLHRLIPAEQSRTRHARSDVSRSRNRRSSQKIALVFLPPPQVMSHVCRHHREIDAR